MLIRAVINVIVLMIISGNTTRLASKMFLQVVDHHGNVVRLGASWIQPSLLIIAMSGMIGKDVLKQRSFWELSLSAIGTDSWYGSWVLSPIMGSGVLELAFFVGHANAISIN